MTTKTHCNKLCHCCILETVCPNKTYRTTHTHATDGKKRYTIRIVNHNVNPVNNSRTHSISRHRLTA